jgi:hypothetical protein
MTLLTISGKGIIFISLFVLPIAWFIYHQIRMSQVRKRTRADPKLITHDNVGHLFKVVELDLSNGTVLLQEGVDLWHDFSFFECWYTIEHIPDSFLMVGKKFKVVFDNGIAVQEVFEYVSPKDEFANNYILPVGSPIKKELSV